MDVKDGGLQRTLSLLASHGRPICHLSKSLMLSLFFSLAQSSSSGDGCAYPQLGLSLGVCIPSMGLNSSGPPEAPILLRCPDDPDCSVLASTSWFPDLLDLAVGRLITLPHCPDLLRQPHFHRHHLVVRRLSLHTWKL